MKAYQERVALTVQEQLARAEANEYFKAGDLHGAATAYERALAATVLAENRLPLLSNLGLCRKQTANPDAARDCFNAALALGAACYEAPGLALKAAGRLLEICSELGDEPGSRAALAECRFYSHRCQEKGVSPPPSLKLPAPPHPSVVEALLMAVGAVGTVESSPVMVAGVPEGEGFEGVREALGRDVGAEAIDDHRMHALALSIHIESMRPALGGTLLSLLLASGTPTDARHEAGGENDPLGGVGWDVCGGVGWCWCWCWGGVGWGEMG